MIGLGGSESGFVRTAQILAKLGHDVNVYNQTDMSLTRYNPNLQWGNVQAFDPSAPVDVFYSLRLLHPFDLRPNAKLKVLFLADTESKGLGNYIRDGRVQLVTAVGHWQKEKIAREETIHDDHWLISSNGIDAEVEVDKEIQKVPGRCLYIATPERGLENLLNIWPEIKARVPHATLHLYSSFIGWGTSHEENEKMCDYIYNMARNLAELGVTNYRHASPREIRRAQLEADCYLYPTDFYETCCMSVLESMYAGAIPVTTTRGALLEKVLNEVTGYTVPAYGGETSRYRKLFADVAVRALTASSEEKAYLRYNMRKYAAQFTYDNLVPFWANEWQSRI